MRWWPQYSPSFPSQQVVDVCDVVAHAELAVTFVHGGRVVVVFHAVINRLVTVYPVS